MPQTLISVGIPGCGKTTVLKPLAQKLGYTYVSPDDIRERLTGDASNHQKEPLVWEVVYERVRLGLQRGGVVIDGTFTKVRDRKGMIAHCRAHGAAEIVALWFDIPYEVCLQRNAKRERAVPGDVLQKMRHRLELNPPDTAEGFSSVARIYQ